MIVIAWVVPLICATNVIGAQYLLPMYRDNHYTVSVCAGAVINIALCLMLIRNLGAIGAAVGTLAAEVMVLAVQAYYVRGELPLLRYARNVLPFVLIGLLMTGVIRIFAFVLVPLAGVSVVTLIAEIIIGIIFFSGASFVYCLATKNENFHRIIGKRLGRLK